MALWTHVYWHERKIVADARLGFTNRFNDVSAGFSADPQTQTQTQMQRSNGVPVAPTY